MDRVTKGAAGLALAAAVCAAPAFARTVVVTTKDPSPSVVTRPALVNARDVIKIREDAMTPFTKVRFKVYPDTTGFRPTNSRCQGQFFTAARKTGSNNKVVITLAPRKPLCKGVLYQAEALIGGAGNDVPDKFAHLCVRGRPSPTSTGCQDNPYYFG